VNYPIRAMDFDPVNDILYTGDEMGYIQRWDLKELFSKLEDVRKKEMKAGFKRPTDLFGLDDKSILLMEQQ
jgi:hypothetical protein